MDINNLIKNIKAKLINNSLAQDVIIEDKTYLHLNHLSHEKNKFHLKLIIYSKDLKKISKLESSRIVQKTLKNEIKNYIHSIQILFK